MVVVVVVDDSLGQTFLAQQRTARSQNQPNIRTLLTKNSEQNNNNRGIWVATRMDTSVNFLNFRETGTRGLWTKSNTHTHSTGLDSSGNPIWVISRKLCNSLKIIAVELVCNLTLEKTTHKFRVLWRERLGTWCMVQWRKMWSPPLTTTVHS